MAVEITHDTGVKARGLGQLLVQFQGKPRMTALLGAWLDEMQEVEDALYTVYVDRLLQSNVATGDLLAKLGDLVGQGSEGVSDAEYRTLIQARIKANRSSGRREELIAIAALLIPSESIYVNDYPPASVMIAVDSVVLPPVLVGKSFLAPATSAGVLLMFVWSSVDSSHTFTLGSTNGSVAVPGINQALGSTNGSVTTGGKLAGVVQVIGGQE